MATLTGSLTYTADNQAEFNTALAGIQATEGYVNIVTNGLVISFDIEQAE